MKTLLQSRNSGNQHRIFNYIAKYRYQVTDHSSQLKGHDQLVSSSYELEDTAGNAIQG